MLYDYILSSVPKGLSDLEIARFLYIKSGMSFCFDTRINNTNHSEFYSLLNKIIIPHQFNDLQINCYIWSQFYSSLLNEFGIKNQTVKYWHSFVNFFIDGKRWVADITFGKIPDLSRIHYGDVTNLFGPCFYDNIDSNMISCDDFSKILDKIDDKISYSKKLSFFRKILCDIKSGKITGLCNNDITSKLNFIFSYLGCLSFGYYESKDIVYLLECDLLSPIELSKISSIELVRKNTSGLVDILQCICINDNGFKYFILCPNLPIYQISLDDFPSLFYLGFFPSKKIPGIDNSYSYPTNNYDFVKKYDFVQSKKRLWFNP